MQGQHAPMPAQGTAGFGEHEAASLPPAPPSRRRHDAGRIALALAAAVTLASLSIFASGRPASTAPATAQAPPALRSSRRTSGLEALPAAARGRISDFLGARDPRFAVHGLAARNPDQGLGLRFTPAGATVAAGSARLGLGLAAYGRPGAMSRPAAATPAARGNEVAYRLGALTESYADGPLGLEQSFELASRPVAGRGPLTFLVLVPGASMRADGGEVLLGDRGQELRYDDLVVTDADGRRVPAALSVQGDDIAIKVDDTGAAYPLHVDPLLQKAVLVNPAAPDDGYGTAVAITGTTIAVGDPYANKDKGTAYVFEEPAGGWATSDEPAATLVGEETGEFGDGEVFGTSVALSGTTLVVGAPGHQLGGRFLGAAYVFRAPASDEWEKATELARLEAAPTNEFEEELFGEHVAVAGQTVAASAPGRQSNVGAVFVYREPGGGWADTTRYGALLHGPSLIAGEGCPQFGDSIALAEHESRVTAAVGEPNVDDEPAGSGSCSHALAGHVYVFTSPTGGWTSEGEFEPTVQLNSADSALEDQFGRSVAISADGGFVLAGAPGQTVAGHPEAGAAYLFTKPGGGWTGSPTPATITAPDAFEGASFGQTVALTADGSRLAVDQPAYIFNEGHFEEHEFNPASDLVYDRPGGGWASTDQPSEELVGSEEEDINVSGFGLGLEGETVINGGSFDEAVEGTTVLVYGPGLGITIESPANGAEYTPGQALTASYHCVAPAGATITKCEGPVAPGARIDTSTEGAYAFTVNAEDNLGTTSSRTVHYLVARAAAKPSPSNEPISKEGSQQIKPATPTVAEEEAHAAQLKKEFKEFIVYVEYILSHPAPIASLLKNGAEASRSLVPEPAWISTSGQAFSWGLPKASANAMSFPIATASSAKGPKSVLAFSHKIHVTKAGKVSLKIPLTAAGRKLAERAVAEHHSLKVKWTITVRPAKSPAQTRTFTVVYKPGASKPKKK
jgi:FG-GAP repeat